MICTITVVPRFLSSQIEVCPGQIMLKWLAGTVVEYGGFVTLL
jgi:hypothetical protein